MDALSPDDEDDGAAAALRDSVRQVLPGLTNLRRLRVADVSVPKADIVAVPRDIDREGLIAVFRDSGFSRIPVYDETLDKPMGLLLLKDLVLKQGFGLADGDLALDTMLRPLLFVPPSMPLTVLLQKMQAERTHMALVIDEYGGVEGLVTIEDLLEQVVGQIEDEHDTDENLWHETKSGVWMVQARAQLDDLNAALDVDLRQDLDDEDVDTLGGLVFLLLGRVPARGEVITLPGGHEIEVIEADPRRLKRLKVRLASARHAG
jgi:magnesium and cobalt transporter